ncbi:MAG TPA: IclR family transcriptional regulator [Rhizobiaceae bacterium]|nr:IclR family transcriptional regulator [Rhizobiaceae bacterium]
MSKIVKRTLDFFELFAEHQRPLSLSEISRLLDIPVSSCHDVLQSLQERGYLYELGPRGGYYPTLRLHRLAGRIAENDPVLQRAEIKLRALRDKFDESVSLSRVQGAQATYLLVFEPSHALRFLVHVGEHIRALHSTSAGKAVLGSLTPSEREKTYRELDLAPFTDKTVKTLDALRTEIDASLARGWFANREESVPGATTLSCSFAWNRSIFIVTVAGPTFRMEPKFDEVVAELVATCQALEAPS